MHGSGAQDWCSWTAATSPTPPAEATDASFAVQQYLSEQERARRRAGDGCVELPPANVLSQAEEALWQFEQLRYAFEGIRLKCTSSKSYVTRGFYET